MIRAEHFPTYWPTIPLERAATFLDHLRRPVTANDRKPGPYPYYGANGQQDSVDGYIFDEPLVLLAEDGGYFGDPTRPISYEINGKTWVNNHAHVLRVDSRVLLTKFLNRVLSYYDVRRFISGTTRAKLTKGDASKIPVPVPARREQQRIVELLERADGLRRKRAEADVVAERILPALFCHFFGEPTANPKGWPKSPLRALADFVSGATPSKEVPEYWGGEIPWVSPKDMKRHELHDALDHITERAVVETGLKRIPAGVPLIVVRGMILAHTVPVCLTRVPVTINQDMKALSPRDTVTGEFLQWALITQHRSLLRLVTTAAHGTRKLDTEALGALQIPVPPPNRRDLIERWSRIVHDHAETTRKRSACGEGIAKIWQVMLHRAFNGDLTAKWREAHMKELLAEMEEQARLINSPSELSAAG